MTVHRVGSGKVHEMTLCSPEAEERGSLNSLYDSKAFDSIKETKLMMKLLEERLYDFNLQGWMACD